MPPEEIESAGDGPSRPISRWGAVAVALVFVGIQIALEEMHALVAEYAFGMLSGMGVAVAIFWKKRARPWFVPALALLALVQIGYFISLGADAFPAHSGKGLEVLAIFEAAVSSGWLAWMAWLFDPHKMPRTPASRTVEIVLYSFAMLAIGVAGFTFFEVQHTIAVDARLLRTVLVRHSSRSRFDVLGCFTRHRSDWTHVDGSSVWRLYDYVQAVETKLEDDGSALTVTFATVRGRALSTRELHDIDRCLGAAAPAA